MRRRPRKRRELVDHELERRRAKELARRRKLEENRKRQISLPAMAAHDRRDRFTRCLVAFYGENRVMAFHGDPREAPRKLGRADEFWTEWEAWQRIGAAEREAVAATKAAATAKLREFF